MDGFLFSGLVFFEILIYRKYGLFIICNIICKFYCRLCIYMYELYLYRSMEYRDDY